MLHHSSNLQAYERYRNDMALEGAKKYDRNTLVGALARVVLEQQRQIDELRDALQSKRATARAR